MTFRASSISVTNTYPRAAGSSESLAKRLTGGFFHLAEQDRARLSGMLHAKLRRSITLYRLAFFFSFFFFDSSPFILCFEV